MASRPTDHPFSRRAFLAGAGGVASALFAPLIPGQRVPDLADGPLAALGAQTAYAADGALFEFDTVSAFNVQCIAVDVTDIGSNATSPIGGASITISSPNANASGGYTQVANAMGSTVFDVRYLMKGFDPATKTFARGTEPDVGEPYSCDAAINLRADGYRQVNLKKVNLLGGKGLALPLCRLADQGASRYFRSVSFNGYDVLYTTATFVHSAGNDAQHELAAELYLKGVGEATVSFWRWRSDSDVFPGFSDRDDANGRNGMLLLASCDASIPDDEVERRKRLDAADERAIAAGRAYDETAYEDRWVRRVSIDERFLQTGLDRGLNEGDRIVACIEAEGRRTAYLTAAQFKRAPLEQVDSGAWDSLPGLGSSDLGFKLPGKIPVIGGSKVSASWLPKLPIRFQVNPLGYMMIGFTLSYAGKVGNGENPLEKDNWKKVKLQDAQTQRDVHDAYVEKLWEEYQTIREDWNNRNQDGAQQTKRVTHKLFSGCEASVNAQFSADLSYSSWDGTLKGGAHFILALVAQGEFGWRITVCGVPLYIAFAPSAQLAFQAGIGMVGTWPDGDEGTLDKTVRFFRELNLSWKDTQVAMTLNVGIAVGAGLGVYGVVSAGVRGSASITSYLGLYDGAGFDAADGYEFPHYRFGAGIDLSVCLQFFMAKYSKQICAASWPAIYDSWGIEKNRSVIAPLSLGPSRGHRTATNLPDEFRLSRGRGGVVPLSDDEAMETDENGDFAVSFEMLAEEGQNVTQAELARSSEFDAAPKARAASQSGAGEPTLVAKYAPADGNSNVDTYDLMLVSAGEEHKSVAMGAVDGQQAGAEGADGDAGAEQAAVPTAAAVAGVAALAGDDVNDAGGVAVGEDAGTAGESAAVENAAGDGERVAGESAAAEGAGSAKAGVGPAKSVADDAAADEVSGDDAAVEDANDNGAADDAGGDATVDDEPLYDDYGNELDFEPAQYDIDLAPAGGHLTNSGIAGAVAGVAGVGEDGTLSPAADNVFLEDVYSDGRVRIARLGRFTIMLRIATGTFAGGHRTCLVYQTRTSDGWSDPSVVSFGVDGIKGISRFDLYDYDFDVHQISNDAIAIALLSGTRPEGDDTTMLSACTNPVTSIIVMSPLYTMPVVSLARSWRSFDGGAELGDDGLYFTFAPCISFAWGSTTSSRQYPCYISGAFLYRRADGGDVLRDETPTHIAGFCLRAVCAIEQRPYGDDYRWALTSAKTFEMTGAPSSVASLSIGNNTSRGRVAFVVGYESAEGCGFFDTAFSHAYDGAKREGTLNVSVSKGTHYGHIKRLLHKRRAEYLGFDRNDVLCELVDGGFAAVAPYEVQTDMDGAEMIVPTVPATAELSGDQTFLVWAENREGIAGFSYDDAGQTDEPQEVYEDGRYRIMASRAVTSGGITLFTRPFTLCQVGYPVDGVASVACDDSAVRIVVSSITNLQYSLSDYHELVLPITALATPTAMVAPGLTLFAGQTSDMEVTLRNDGNTQLAGVTLVITDKDGEQLVDPREIDFGPDTVVTCPGAKPDPDDSLADPIFDSGFRNVFSPAGGADGTPFDADAFAAHPLVADEGRDFLTPGGTAVVNLPLDVPEDWSGKVTLSVAVRGLKFVNPVNGEVKAVVGAGVTAACDDNGNISSIAAISDEALADAARPFEDANSVDVSLSETLDADSFRMDELRMAQPIDAGATVDPGSGSGSGSGEGTGSGEGSGSGSGEGSGNGYGGKPGDDAGGGAGGGKPGGGSPAGADSGGKPGGEGGGLGGILPTLGDHAAGFGAAGALAALAGAGLVAYSHRRAQIAAESEAAEHDEPMQDDE